MAGASIPVDDANRAAGQSSPSTLVHHGRGVNPPVAIQDRLRPWPEPVIPAAAPDTGTERLVARLRAENAQLQVENVRLQIRGEVQDRYLERFADGVNSLL